ncbi:MAG: large subunit ribosomal protein L9 [Thermoproteota archaeon]|jgi:large subunit ribosomal protein L9
MKVILTEKVKTLGNVGEIVTVSEGYGRNFLIPGKKGMIADDRNKQVLINAEKRLATKVAGQKSEAEAMKKQIDGLTIELTKKIGSNGKIFGSVTNTELAAELAKKDITIERRVIIIEDAIKSVGTFEVKVKLFSGVEANFNVKIEMDAKQVEEFKKSQAAAEKRAAAKAAAVASGDATDEETTSEETSEENAEETTTTEE